MKSKNSIFDFMWLSFELSKINFYISEIFWSIISGEFTIIAAKDEYIDYYNVRLPLFIKKINI